MINLKFACPVCHCELTQFDKSLKCEHNHSFDLAKKGYANLLLSHQMSSKQPGDNKEMIQARTQFLEKGYYEPLIKRITQILIEQKVEHLLDAGCGEGYYTEYLKQSINFIDGLDISKEGILQGCRRDQSINWCIGSVSALPYLEESFDAVLSVFCRTEEEQFKKVLKQNGLILFVGPGDDHLPNLRAQLYDEVLPYQSDKQEDYFKDSFKMIHEEKLDINFTVVQEDILPLLSMTPHYWKCTKENKEKLLAMNELKETGNFSIRLFRKL